MSRPVAADRSGFALALVVLLLFAIGVAGATGYLGGFVVRELKARGHFVRALARSPRKLDSLQDSLDEIAEAEVTRPESLGGGA